MFISEFTPSRILCINLTARSIFLVSCSFIAFIYFFCKLFFLLNFLRKTRFHVQANNHLPCTRKRRVRKINNQQEDFT